MPARHTQSHNTARRDTGVYKCKDKIEGIQWDNKTIKALGICFGHDIDKCDEWNWEGKINQIIVLNLFGRKT
jgi:hypothetical protein